jgi:tetratricopeptide (TPR) repeat protein
MIRESRQANTQEDLTSIFTLLSRYNHNYNFFQSVSWESGKYWYLHACEFTKWVSAYPQYFSDQISLANFYSALGRWNLFNYHFSTALDYFYQAIHLRQAAENKISSTSATDYTFIGYCYFQTGYYSQSLKVLNQVEEIHRSHAPSKPLAFSTFLDIKGACLIELRELEEALKCFHEGVKTNQNYQGDKYKNRLSAFDAMTFCLVSNIARTLRDLGRYEESMEYFNRAEILGIRSCGKDHPYYLVYIIEKAPLLVKMGRPQEALQMMEKVVNEYYALNQKKNHKNEEFGELALTWYSMGMVYLDLNKISKAKVMFKKSRNCSHKYVGKQSHFTKRAHHGLGLAYLKEKKIRKGLHHLLQELRLHTDYCIRPDLLVPLFEEFQKTLTGTLHVKGSAPYVLKAFQEAAILSEKALGKDHALTAIFHQNSMTIDNLKIKN